MAVSPEEKGAVFAGMQIQSAAEAPREATHWAHDVQIISADASSTHLYHIIVITYEGNMILPQKYAHELHAAANETCIALGAVTAKSVSSRNHMHILCRMPSTITLGKFLDKMRAELGVRLHSNSHFRKFRGWYKCDVIYTVSPCRIDFEEYNFGHQPELHSRRACANEMSAIYQRLQIPYVVSLN